MGPLAIRVARVRDRKRSARPGSKASKGLERFDATDAPCSDHALLLRRAQRHLDASEIQTRMTTASTRMTDVDDKTHERPGHLFGSRGVVFLFSTFRA